MIQLQAGRRLRSRAAGRRISGMEVTTATLGDDVCDVRGARDRASSLSRPPREMKLKASRRSNCPKRFLHRTSRTSYPPPKHLR